MSGDVDEIKAYLEKLPNDYERCRWLMYLLDWVIHEFYHDFDNAEYTDRCGKHRDNNRPYTFKGVCIQIMRNFEDWKKKVKLTIQKHNR